MVNDISILEAALIGYQIQLEQIQGKIAEIQKRLGTSTTKAAPSATAPVAATPKQKRVMSPEGRQRILDALKKRWSEYRAAKEPAEQSDAATE